MQCILLSEDGRVILSENHESSPSKLHARDLSVGTLLEFVWWRESIVQVRCFSITCTRKMPCILLMYLVSFIWRMGKQARRIFQKVSGFHLPADDMVPYVFLSLLFIVRGVCFLVCCDCQRCAAHRDPPRLKNRCYCRNCLVLERNCLRPAGKKMSRCT